MSSILFGLWEFASIVVLLFVALAVASTFFVDMKSDRRSHDDF